MKCHNNVAINYNNKLVKLSWLATDATNHVLGYMRS